jgi:hypothetical protein
LIDADLNHRAAPFVQGGLPYTDHIVYPDYIAYLTYIPEQRGISIQWLVCMKVDCVCTARMYFRE